MSDSNETSKDSVWEIGQPVYLADLHESWTVSRVYLEQTRYVRLTRPTTSGRTEARHIRDVILRRHQDVIQRRLDRDIQATLGFRLRGLRVERDITQEELAPLAGMHTSMIGHIELGGRNINLRQIDELALALGVHPGQLLADPGHWAPAGGR